MSVPESPADPFSERTQAPDASVISFASAFERLPWSLFKPCRGLVEQVLGVPTFNRFYAAVAARHTTGNFFERTLRVVNVGYHLPEEDLAKIPVSGPVFMVSNHPHGMIDGIIMGSILTRARGDDPDAIKIIANQMLLAMPLLAEWVVAVDIFAEGAERGANIAPLRRTIRLLRNGGLAGTFPSGTVSHLTASRRSVVDPEWIPNLGTLIRKSGATVVPMYIHGRNSWLFQAAGLVNWRLRTALLIREFNRMSRRSVEVRLGTPIPPKKLDEFASDEAMMDFLRTRTYVLANRITPSDRRKALRFPRPIGQRHEQPIISPIPPEQLAAAIAALPERALLTRSGNFAVYAAAARELGPILREIGRLREETFRQVGEGTGEAFDLDGFDETYDHLFIWDEDAQKIVGAYRMGRCDRLLDQSGAKGLYTATLFRFRPRMLEILRSAIEMGRSFVALDYQKKHASLALLWRGIGEYLNQFPQYRILFGPVSISADYHRISKNLLVRFLMKQAFDPDQAELVRAKHPPKVKAIGKIDPDAFESLDDLDDISALISEIESDHKGVPVLLRQYLKLSGKILSFNVDPDFARVIDGLIFVDLSRTEPRLLKRFMGEDGMRAFLARHSNATIPSEPDESAAYFAV